MSTRAFGRFREAFIAGDADALAQAFFPDAAYATNAGMLLEGRVKIRAGAAEWFRRRPPGAVVELETRVLRFNESGDVRWELLEYHQHGSVPDQPEAGSIDESGYALAAYRRGTDDAWSIESLVVNLQPPTHR